MPVSKSRTVVVMLQDHATDRTEVHLLYLHRDVEDRLHIGKGLERREAIHLVHIVKGSGWKAGDRDKLIFLLQSAGLTVRFYDAEEKRWMATDIAQGPRVVDGDRAGSWGVPTPEEFEADYLKR